MPISFKYLDLLRGLRLALPPLLLLALPHPVLAGATAPSCGRLCAHWQLDPAASTDPAAAIDAAVATYKEEKPRHRPAPSDLAGLAKAELDDSLGPYHSRPPREELREELQHLLVIPPEISVRVDGEEVLIDAGHGATRRFSPGEPYARVDKLGTAEIRSQWQRGSFMIRESYKHGRDYRETYTVDPKIDRLVVTRSIERPSMKEIILHSVYRPAAQP